MTTGDDKQVSNSFSTGGGGVNFEARVQASFAALMLAGGFAPCLPCRSIQKIKLQGRTAGYETDDFILFTSHPDGSDAGKLLGQIKHSIALTEGSRTFGEVVRAAWNDFNKPAVFTRNKDAIVLVTGPLRATDIDDVRPVLEWARHFETATEFFTNVDRANFSSSGKREKLKAFRVHLNAAAGKQVSNEELFQFLGHFHLLGYDLDIRSGMMHALLHTVIGRHAPANPLGIWAQILDVVISANQNAGTLFIESFPEDLRAAFRPVLVTMPEALSSTVPPSQARAWNSAEFAAALVVANLLGAWNEKSEADRAVINSLTLGKMDEWQQTIREVLQLPGSPLSLQGGVWTVRNRGDLWHALGPRVFDEHLKSVAKCAAVVLTERDPRLALAPDKRLAAAMYGSVLKHSSHLRKGLAETLALLGSRSGPLTNCSPGAAESTAVRTVRAVLEGADWALWGSVNDLLPLLAEAAPAEFLAVVEHALEAKPCPFVALFAQETGGIMGRNYLTGLLWALETLAWDDQMFVRSVVLLGALATRDPGGQGGNRPANSLTTILLPWLPQTTASIPKRLVAVETILREYPDAAWQLLLRLLPAHSGTSMGTQKPRWRSAIPEVGSEELTREAYSAQIDNYAKLAVDVALTDLTKVRQLAIRLDRLPPAAAARVLQHISSASVTGRSEDERLALWSSLIGLVRKHRRFHDAKWALPADRVSEIESAAISVAPASPELVYRELFGNSDRDLYETQGNWQAEARALDARRQEAIGSILTAGGLAALVRLAESVDSPRRVGIALGMSMAGSFDSEILPAFLRCSENKKQEFARGFVVGRFSAAQWPWVDGLDVSSWPLDDVVQLLVCLPFDATTWKRTKRLLGSEAGRYWQVAFVNPYQAESELHTAVGELLKNGRPRAAVDCLACMAHGKQPLDRAQAVTALLSSVSSDEPIHTLCVYNAVAVIQSLQSDPDTVRADIVNVEWAYLPVLDEHHGASPRIIESSLSADPRLFCEFIEIAFRSENDVEPRDDLTEEQKTRAENAYRILHQWRVTPGTRPDGSFSGDSFSRWISEVKQLTEASGHLTVALHQAGEVFVHCPADPDGLWPHRAVAEVLNRPDMEELRRGYFIGMYNSRDACYVDPSGQPEKELSGKYGQMAEQIEDAGFHRLAATFRELASTYDSEAERIRARALPGEIEGAK